MRRLSMAAAAVVVVDQVSKFLASSSTTSTPTGEVITNAGTLAGIIPLGGLRLLLLAVFALVGFIFVGVRLARDGRVSWLVLGFLIGGAIGNLIDRAFLGQVRDFIWIPWLVVNIADIALAIGAALFIWSMVTSRSALSKPA